MKELLEQLEDAKQAGMYSVSLMYGEDVGCDDLEVPPLQRRVLFIGHPVGFLGEVRVMFKGPMELFLKHDWNNRPQQISNPPQNDEHEQGGWFVWGTENAMERFYERWPMSRRASASDSGS